MHGAYDQMWSAHNGVHGMTQRIRGAGLYFPKVGQKCAQWVRTCDVCQRLVNKCKLERYPFKETEVMIGGLFRSIL
jgi:hypothetical protein